MVTVHKYELEEVPGSNVILMPRSAQVLSAQWHPAKGGISLWALLDDEEKEKRTRLFIVANTGGTYLEKYGSGDLFFIGTCQESQGTIVWHVFERLGPDR